VACRRRPARDAALGDRWYAPAFGIAITIAAIFVRKQIPVRRVDSRTAAATGADSSHSNRAGSEDRQRIERRTRAAADGQRRRHQHERPPAFRRRDLGEPLEVEVLRRRRVLSPPLT
jgi:hypothetical protein